MRMHFLVQVAGLCAGMFSAVIAIFGCRGAGTQRGNFTPFLIEEMQHYGARVIKTNGLPEVAARWTIERDTNGFECLIYGTSFQNVEHIVTNALATIGVAGDQTTGATAKYRQFKASLIGVGLLMKQNKDAVQINCIAGGIFSPFRTNTTAIPKP